MSHLLRAKWLSLQCCLASEMEQADSDCATFMGRGRGFSTFFRMPEEMKGTVASVLKAYEDLQPAMSRDDVVVRMYGRDLLTKISQPSDVLYCWLVSVVLFTSVLSVDFQGSAVLQRCSEIGTERTAENTQAEWMKRSTMVLDHSVSFVVCRTLTKSVMRPACSSCASFWESGSLSRSM